MEKPVNFQFYLEDGSKIVFQNINPQKYPGWLPGSRVTQSPLQMGSIAIQTIHRPLFSISHQIFRFLKKLKLTIAEPSGIRLEALISGEIQLINGNKTIKLKAGQYHLTDIPLFGALFRKGNSCGIFITYYSKEFLKEEGLEIVPSLPKKMPAEMSKLIQDILNNSYDEKLRDFFYNNSVRDLLFFHLTHDKKQVPSELEYSDVAAIYKADTIIASDINQHHTIASLAKLTGINQFKIKKGFRQIFGMGAFHRLIFRRMENAKTLLETTNKSIGEIAQLTGYDSASSFINSFRREFNKTPREWRKEFLDEN